MEQYQELFDSLLNEQGAKNIANTITDLSTYFKVVSGLTNLPNKYYRVPLDEPYFKVDMNARTITVPNDFKNNGIGVKGDANAEILFFEADRYFDGADLSNDSELKCYIQWSTGTKKGNSIAILADAVDQKVIFGWMITPDMTEAAGTINFSVRWFKTITTDGVTSIEYSVGTQQASCTIKGSLDLDVIGMEPDESVKNLALHRPKFSGIINSLTGAHPLITTNLETNNLYLSTDALSNLSDIEKTAIVEVLGSDLLYSDGSHDGICPLSIVAASPNATETDDDADSLSYQWFKGGEAINGATANSYNAYTAGAYYVKVGYQDADTNNVGYTTSYVAKIPAAADITFDSKNANYPTWGYSQFDTTKEDMVISYPVVNNQTNGKTIYKWTVEGNQAIEIDSGVSSYVIPDNFEGTITCSAYNRLNNTISAELPKKSIAIRCMPRVLPKPELTYDESTKTLIATPKYDEDDSITSKHTNELIYSWYYQVNSSGTFKPISNTSNSVVLSSILTAAGTYDFYCSIQHVIPKNAEGFGNTAVCTSDYATNSEFYTITVK